MKDVETDTPLEEMVQNQIAHRGITDERVLEAMRSVRRAKFVPAEERDFAYADQALPIGHGQTISQPYIVALMTEKLQIDPKSRVLEIGTGSGYQTAILAKLALQVWTIERLKPLLDEAFERHSDMGLRNIHYRFGDGSIGWPEAGPFDRIIITAGEPSIPHELLISQLVDGGIAVLPVGPMDRQVLVSLTRKGNELSRQDICACRFVKLVGLQAWPSE